MSENKRELVLAAFDNKKTQRVPVGFWFHFAADAFYDPSEETVKRNIDGHQKYVDEFDPDFLKLMSDGFFGYPNKTVEAVESAEDLDRVKPALPKEWIDGQVRLVKELTGRFGESRTSFYNVFSPATYFSFLLENAGKKITLSQFAKENPEGLSRALQAIAEDVAALAKGVINEGGADGIYLSVRNLDGVSKEDYLKYVAPAELKVLEAANGASDYNILHICGYKGHRNDLSTYADYPAKILNWAVTVENVSLKEGKSLFGGRAVIGGFDNTESGVLYRGSKEEIEKETIRLLSEIDESGVILGADCTIPSDTPIAHLEWVREAAKTIRNA